jgi:hypothetical protein
MADVPDRVSMLERDLREIFGGRLQSVVVYGLRSSADTHAHAHGPHAPAPVTRTMAVVDALTGADLKACADRAAKWLDANLATPLLLAADEFGRSLDVFPLEFGAILADHVLVAGRNPFDGLEVDPVDIRRATEVQARSHLLHLREGYVETRGRADALAVLIVKSAPPFAALLTSVARLLGLATVDPAAAGRLAERELQVSPGVVTGIVALAHVKEISSAEATRMFPAYLDAVDKLVKYVDGWSAK